MFLAGHPSQGCFGLQSHCAPCYFFNKASFYPSDFSFKGLNIHQYAQKIRALQTVLEAKREEFVDNALIYAKSLCEGLEISFEPPRRIRRKHTFDLRRTTFSSIDRVTVDIRERFQQLQNLAQKYALLRPEVILNMDELNLDQLLKTLIKKNSDLSAYVYRLS
ncbi:uncharacterized protein TNCV_1824881 [Trichonephila clavipes]|nr:uncharacterized protein TNCV_1824881 [Trichonephila clavipes]